MHQIVMLVQHEKESVFSSPPRRNSEEWHGLQLRADTEIAFIDDDWLYQWTGTREPPEPFRYHKTLFRQCTPSDISKNGWHVLKLATRELGKVFNVRLKQSDSKYHPDPRPTYKLEWLLLNHYHRCPCLLGLYGDKFVVAATKASKKRLPFVPFNLYQILHQNPLWKNQRFRAGYRHFQALFDIGFSFYTDRQHLRCDITYGVDVGVHGCGSVWAVLDFDGILIPAPYRIPLRNDLSDLPGKVEQMNTNCRLFIQQLGAAWLKAIDADSVYNLIRRYTHNTDVPRCVREELRTNPQLDRCYTRLDVLLEIMKAVHLRQEDNTTSFIPLSQKFVSTPGGKCHVLTK